MSISILRLAVSFLVVLVLLCFAKPRWFIRVVVYLRRNTQAAMAIADLIDSMESLEGAVTRAGHNRSTWTNPLPEDIQQRSVKLPERFRR